MEETQWKNLLMKHHCSAAVSGGRICIPGKGCGSVCRGSSSVAKRFKGAVTYHRTHNSGDGDITPETAVSVAASITHNNTLAVSNVTGSNIFNLMVVIGVCAIMTPVAVDGASLRRDFPFSMICAILLLVMGVIGMTLGRVDGIILLGFFRLYFLSGQTYFKGK